MGGDSNRGVGLVALENDRPMGADYGIGGGADFVAGFLDAQTSSRRNMGGLNVRTKESECSMHGFTIAVRVWSLCKSC
jgi:hypothetical protein